MVSGSVLIMQPIVPSLPSTRSTSISTSYAPFETLMSVFPNPIVPGKSSSKIVTLHLVSSPGSLSSYPCSCLRGSKSSTQNSRSGFHSSSSTIGIWIVFSNYLFSNLTS